MNIYHFNARFYSPRLGRFLSADTIVPGYANSQNLNRYSYVLNQPLRYTDPTGHWENETNDPIKEQRENAREHAVERERNRKEREESNGGETNNPLELRPSQLATIDVTLPIPTLPPSTGTRSPSRSTIYRIAEFGAGVFLVGAGLMVTALGGVLVTTGLVEITGLAALAPPSVVLTVPHGGAAIAVGGIMAVTGLFITGVGGYLIYDSLVPSTPTPAYD